MLDKIGADIASSWTFNEHGDLDLASDEENITQAITNRLSTWLNDFDLYYLEYGSVFTSYLGWRKNEETLRFMQLELENTLKQDPRLQDFDIELEFNEQGGVNVYLTINFEDTDMSLSLVVSEDGSINIIENNTNEEE